MVGKRRKSDQVHPLPFPQPFLSSFTHSRLSVDRVLGAYLIPALDSFGSHRIMFGSSPTPLTLSTTHQAHRITPIPVVQNPRKDWHAVVLKVFRSIKLDPVSVGEIMGETASRVYMGTTGLDV